MKILNKIIFVFFLLTLSTLSFAKDMAYMKIGITEGFIAADYKGQEDLSLGFTNAIVTDLGYKYEIDEQSELFFIYELSYDGPGLKGDTKQGFNARGIDHFVVAKYFYKLSDQIRLFAKADFFYEFYRVAKSEQWSDGLYNFGKTGIGLGMDWKTSSQNLFTWEVNLHYFWFPNYDDLSREAIYLLAGSGSGEGLSADSVNQNFIQALLKVNDTLQLSKEFQLNFEALFIYRYYPRLTVSTENFVNPSAQKQRDFTLEGTVGMTYFPDHDWVFDLRYTLSYFNSNYNYFFIKNASPFEYEYYRNFSSYLEHRVSTPISYIVSDKSSFSLIPMFEYKQYINRPPKKNLSGTYDLLNPPDQFDRTKEQYQYALSGTLLWTYKKHENFSIIPQYNFKIAKSNNKDEMLGYNFMAHYLGIQFLFEY